VDLTSQSLRAYDAAGARYLETSIASGRIATPTRPGSYRVWLRVPAQWMTGPGYRVWTEWVQYFDEARALHSADWLQEWQYGQPQSHGCVNMRNADAKMVWDATSGDTPVIVTGVTPGAENWCPDDKCADGQMCGTATDDPCVCGDGTIAPGEVCDSSTGPDGSPEPDATESCPGDSCSDGQRCGTVTDDPCVCDGQLIGPGAVCVIASGGSPDPAPSDACMDWQCDDTRVCVDGAWQATTCTAQAGVDRVCRAGWCDWP
jgi:hypothetical protein